MFENRPKLGKGLEALIPKSYLAQGKTITQLPLSDIQMNPFQPRHEFDDDKIASLADSIRHYGLNQPILVRKVDDGYQLIAGERRYRACVSAELVTIPAIIRNVSDKQSLELALIENLEREDLNPIDEARGYRRLIDEFSFTHADLAKISKNKNRSTITNVLRLLNLPQAVQDSLVADEITAGHARALLSIEDEKQLLKQFDEIKKTNLTVRDLEFKVREGGGKKRRRVARSPYLEDISKKLESVFDSSILISGNEKKGKIQFSYSSKDELVDLLSKFNL